MNKWDNRFLGLAEYVAAWSKDPSTQVGAVIVDEKNRIVSLGFNGFPRGVTDDNRLDNRDRKYDLMVHAEINALLFANKNVEGCTIYTWPMPPCCRCAAQIIQAGIKRVVSPSVESNERWTQTAALAQTMFKESGVDVLIV